MQFEQLMRDRDPVVGVPALTPSERKIFATRAIETAAQPQERRPRAIRWTAAAAALVIGGTLFGVQAMNAVAPASAAQIVLQEASINATDEPALASQYWEITSIGYSVVSEDFEPNRRFYSVSEDRRDWVAVDGTRANFSEVAEHQLLEQVAGPKAEHVLTEKQAAGATFTTNIAPVDLGPETSSFEPFGVSPTWLDSLPTDIEALDEELRQTLSADTDLLLFENVSRILTSHLADAELRRALFGVLEAMPDIEVSQKEITLDDRIGVGLALGNQPDWGIVLVVDPEGGDVIGSRQYQKMSELPDAPVVVMEQLAISKTLVDDIPADVREEAAMGDCTITDVMTNCEWPPE